MPADRMPSMCPDRGLIKAFTTCSGLTPFPLAARFALHVVHSVPDLRKRCSPEGQGCIFQVMTPTLEGTEVQKAAR